MIACVALAHPIAGILLDQGDLIGIAGVHGVGKGTLDVDAQVAGQDLHMADVLHLLVEGGDIALIAPEQLHPVDGPVRLREAAHAHAGITGIENVGTVARRVHPGVHDSLIVRLAEGNVFAGGPGGILAQDGEAAGAVGPGVRIVGGQLHRPLHGGVQQRGVHGQGFDTRLGTLLVYFLQNGLSLFVIKRALHGQGNGVRRIGGLLTEQSGRYDRRQRNCQGQQLLFHMHSPFFARHGRILLVGNSFPGKA